MKDDKRICDNCQYFKVSPGGCVDTCLLARSDYLLTDWYFEQRRDGIAQRCARFLAWPKWILAK